jgi:hypothetical protein
MHRAVLLTADRYPPGALITPRQSGAVPARICRLSGLLATDRCPGMTEWFAPAAAPARRCDWHAADGIRLPAEYARWTDGQMGRPAETRSEATGEGGLRDDAPAHLPNRPSAHPPVRVPAESFRIVTPEEGDRYEVPPGVQPRYATIALRAGGGTGHAIRWTVDGHGVPGERWALRPGAHVVRAEAGPGERAEVRIDVE